jgi:hypothetical protein
MITGVSILVSTFPRWIVLQVKIVLTTNTALVSGPENWNVYKAWWGNKPIMAKGDVSGIAGVNSFNAIHPVSLVSRRKCSKPGQIRLTHYCVLFVLVVFCCFGCFCRENCSSVVCPKYPPKPRSTFDGQSWSVPFANMEVPVA